MDKQKNNITKNTISLAQALATIDKHLSTRHLKSHDCPVSQAHGHVLTQKVFSRLNLPPFNKSAMDGYAVTAEDRRDLYTVLENIPAGKTPTKPLKPGTASRVMTGAPVPENTDRVIMFEHTDNGSEQVKVFKHSDKTNICMKGEDIHTGKLIYQPGINIGAIEMANMLACGIHTVRVYDRPKIAILTTGNEIVSDPADLAPGQII
ncbi:MAG: hypothetical protein K9M57_10705, partial [Phycisphaerae bacterium]|nr:hypothetical protein [Phycisphaerae bacterium]